MNHELTNLKKQRRQSIKNMEEHLIFSRFEIREELMYYEEVENLNDIESQIIEVNLKSK